MKSEPQLSIVVCTFNRAHYLQDTLRTLCEQDCEADAYEVVVVDNNSSDDTSAVYHSFAEAHPDRRFRYVLEKEQGLSHARNRGMREARGDLIAFVDDDIFADRRYAQVLLDYFRSHPDVDAVGGRIEVHYDAPAPEWMSSYLMPLLGEHDLGSEARPYPPHKYPLGGNMCFRSELLRQSRGFDPALGRKDGELLASEEKDLFHHLRAEGAIIHHVPLALVHHRVDAPRLTPAFVRRQALGVGRSERRRVASQGVHGRAAKGASELIKAAGTLALAGGFLARGEVSRARMLVLFRLWVWQGLLGAS